MSRRWACSDPAGRRARSSTEIGLLKAAGAVAFTDGAKSITNAQVMRRALTYAGDFDALVVHHTEDPDLVADGVMNEGEYAARIGLYGIPKAAESDRARARHLALKSRLPRGALSRGLDHSVLESLENPAPRARTPACW